MLIVSETTLNEIMSALVAASHGCTGLDGSRKHIGTIDAKSLRNAALAALLITTGQVVATADALQKG